MVSFSGTAYDSPLSVINNLLVKRIPYVLLQIFCLDHSRNNKSYQHIRKLDQYFEGYPQLHENPHLELHLFNHSIQKMR